MNAQPRIVTTRLPDHLYGCYDAHSDTIWVDDRLTPAERRCTLTHEHIHAERGDTALADRVLEAKQERAVHQEAARRLVSVDDLAEALKWAVDAREIAACLDVDLPTLQARLDLLNEYESAYLREIAEK
jgi:hypothetical protein